MIKNFLRSRKYGTPIIVVSGLPRSGTSMMMKMLDAGGVDVVTDKLRTADEDNPKGYFEDERIKELEKMDDKSWVRDCRGKAIKVISFLLKDLPDDSFYKVIFMRRSFEEVLASQRKMLERRGEPTGTEEDDKRMVQAYEAHLRKVGVMLQEAAHFDSIEVNFRAALDQPREHAERVQSFLGIPLDVEKMSTVSDRKLYRNRA